MKRRPRLPQPPLWGTNKPTTHANCALLLWHIPAHTSLPEHLSVPSHETRCWKSTAEKWQSSPSGRTDIFQLFMLYLNQGTYCRHKRHLLSPQNHTMQGTQPVRLAPCCPGPGIAAVFIGENAELEVGSARCRSGGAGGPGRDHPDPPLHPLCVHYLLGVPQV